jgi:hypothetical protein
VSIFPCDLHGSRIRGSLGGAYITLLRGTDRYKRVLRVCSLCATQLRSDYEDQWVDVSDDVGVLESGVCSACRSAEKPMSQLFPIFVTVFEKGNERADYFAEYCPSCSDAMCDKLGLTLERGRRP